MSKVLQAFSHGLGQVPAHGSPPYRRWRPRRPTGGFPAARQAEAQPALPGRKA